MEDTTTQEAADLLENLGLKQYEARSFIALCRLPQATAKEIAEHSDVPRTRVYDAVRSLESMGLVEIHHRNPQQFRAVPIDEAAATLQEKYETRIADLRETVEGFEPADREEEETITHDVWSLSGEPAIRNRTNQLIDRAEEELVFVIGNDEVRTPALTDHIRDAQDRGVDVILGTISEQTHERVRSNLPDVELFVSGLEWLQRSADRDDDTEIRRLMLIDRTAILVSSSGPSDAQAIYGDGFDNGIVVIARRLMATGLLPRNDPERGN